MGPWHRAAVVRALDVVPVFTSSPLSHSCISLFLFLSFLRYIERCFHCLVHDILPVGRLSCVPLLGSSVDRSPSHPRPTDTVVAHNRSLAHGCPPSSPCAAIIPPWASFLWVLTGCPCTGGIGWGERKGVDLPSAIV